MASPASHFPLPDAAAPAFGLSAFAAGEGDEVVLVHGAAGDYRQWTPIARRLTPGYCTVAISRRYHWPNPPPPPGASYSYETHGDDLARYLGLRGRRVHLVGHSYGVGVVLVTALREPSLARSLTLIEPAVASLLPAEAPGLHEELESRNVMVAEVRALAESGSAEDAARTLIDWTQGGPGGFAALDPDVQRGLLENAATVGPTFATGRRPIGTAALARLSVPTLVLNGERTRLYYRLIGEAVAASIPGASADRVPAAAHMAIVENAAHIAARLRMFLDAL